MTRLAEHLYWCGLMGCNSFDRGCSSLCFLFMPALTFPCSFTVVVQCFHWVYNLEGLFWKSQISFSSEIAVASPPMIKLFPVSKKNPNKQTQENPMGYLHFIRSWIPSFVLFPFSRPWPCEGCCYFRKCIVEINEKPFGLGILVRWAKQPKEESVVSGTDCYNVPLYLVKTLTVSLLNQIWPRLCEFSASSLILSWFYL